MPSGLLTPFWTLTHATMQDADDQLHRHCIDLLYCHCHTFLGDLKTMFVSLENDISSQCSIWEYCQIDDYFKI